jgi:hypothetical protein
VPGVRALSFRYSIGYYDLVEVVGSEFDDWLRRKLESGGVNEVHVAHQVASLVQQHVPTSPRQLLELTMQCEALLDAELGEPMLEAATDLYDALRLAVADYFGERLWAHWRHVQATEARSVDDLRPEDGGAEDATATDPDFR